MLARFPTRLLAVFTRAYGSLMSFEIEEFIAKRPYLYHLTSSTNLRPLQSIGHLRSTTMLRQLSRPVGNPHARRDHSESISVAGFEVVLCDQKALGFGHVDLWDGLTEDGLLQLLNRRVFFWPGTAAGPIDYGSRHFGRYESERPLVLRVPTEALLGANPDIEPMFCKYNSGSPRTSRGNKSPRGPSTFQSAATCEYSVASVVEFTVEEQVRLPIETERADSYEGPWTPFYAGSMAPRDLIELSEFEL